MTPEQTAVSSDLHWLIHQGHVIEFSNGKMETAKKPKVQPQKPKAKPKPKANVDTGEKVSASDSALKHSRRHQPLLQPQRRHPLKDLPMRGSPEALKPPRKARPVAEDHPIKRTSQPPQLLLQVPRSLRIAKAIIPSQVHLKDLLTMRPMNHRLL